MPVDPQVLENSGASFQNLFKTGGGLDLMLAADPSSDQQRRSAAPGGHSSARFPCEEQTGGCALSSRGNYASEE
jgi:hypothetical protein